MDFIKLHTIRENVYLFEEMVTDGASVTMMLIVGEEKAAIIDTGFGFSDSLLHHIQTTTDKPVICLLTHCDPDHAGGATMFEEIYMNSQDEELMKSSLNPAIRLKILGNLVGDNSEKLTYAKKNILRKNKFQYHSIITGDTFDLGGCVLEAIALPGHTKGSMCYFNKKENYLFAGDSIANQNAAILFFDKCISLGEFKLHLDAFIDYIGKGTTIYTGHDSQPLAPQIVSEISMLCSEILAGDTANDEPHMPPFLQSKIQDNHWFASQIQKAISAFVLRKQLGNSIPRTHIKKGYTASVRYNANKI